MKLVDDVEKAWKWVSVQCMALGIGVQGVWAMLADDMKADLPSWAHKAVAYGTVALLLLGIGGRVVKQDHKDAP